MGRRMHSRTLSLSRTLTSRQTSLAPDWLLGVARPAHTATATATSTSFESPELERGMHGADSKPELTARRAQPEADVADQHVHEAPEGALVISDDEATMEHSRWTALGEEGMGLEVAGPTDEDAVNNSYSPGPSRGRRLSDAETLPDKVC